jgi:hypothetical protein
VITCFASRAPAGKTQPWFPAPAAILRDEYVDDEADYDAEDREQPSVTAEIPGDEPEDDVLEQRQEVPYGDDEQ